LALGRQCQRGFFRSTRRAVFDYAWQVSYPCALRSRNLPCPSQTRNAFYAQSGGVTAVINASACGVIETCRKHKNKIGKVYAGRHGIVGALTEDLIDTSKESAAAIRALRHTPSGAFGSARYKLKKYSDNPAQYQRLIDVFKAHDIGYFFTTAAAIRRTPV